MNNLKSWWAPVWTGLVMDREGTHCRRMKTAVWLWLYCVLNANRSTGVLFRKIDTISGDMGVSRNTVIRWLNVLRAGGYIETRNTGRHLVLRVRKWKTGTGSAPVPQQKTENADTRSSETATSQTPLEDQNPLCPSPKRPFRVVSNDRSITKEILKIDIDDVDISGDSLGVTTRGALLAKELAQALNDHRGMPFYRSITRRVPEGVLRSVLGQVKEIPAEEIKTSRGALFNFLIRKYLDQRVA